MSRNLKIAKETELVSISQTNKFGSGIWCHKSSRAGSLSVTDDRINIQTDLVRKLVLSQFPQFENLPISRVANPGWDNHTFRLGHEMIIRMPSAKRYASQVKKEQKWLPWLSSRVTYTLPEPLFQGKPEKDYPWDWSIYKWIEGKSLSEAGVAEKKPIAKSLAQFLRELHRLNASDGPHAGEQNFHRGGDLNVYDGESRDALAALKNEIDTKSAGEIWERSLKSRWQNVPVWVHGDLNPANMLIKDGELHAVIDFGSCAIGDPACDLSMAWTYFEGHSNEAFRSALGLDRQTWERAQGWTLWKALISLRAEKNLGSTRAHKLKKLIQELIAD